MSLYQLSEQIKNINELLDDEEFTNEQAVIDAFNSLEMEFTDKVAEIWKLHKETEALAETTKAEKQRLEKIQKTYERKQQRLRNLIYASMLNANVKKIDNPLFRLTMTSPIMNKVDIAENAVIPNEYYIPQEPKLDRTALLNALKNGVEIKGVVLTGSPQLRGL
ncbi:siphovirus Gp157 family protein [Gallibacterium salpingitidis]|uniref:siphovirus Gp157 family protein n=1 Tax=Gallibacterium salpingitidis TaxID=505341 RepID=UPI0026708116|nr:siphovirus Gp157 family protein [Gallibacterium salpingitidis]WKT00492.1 siphovirus Gp157 family protein [Gallibacterium salpingitidis]